MNPWATSWFKTTATGFLTPVPGYLAILCAHRVPCVKVISAVPGAVLYEDDYQVVVAPATTEGERGG